MRIPSLTRLRDLGQRGKQHNDLMLRLSDSRVNGHSEGVKVVCTGRGGIENVKISDSLKGKTTLIEQGFLKACEDARRKMHELKRYHWNNYYEEETKDSDYRRYEDGSPQKIKEAVESLASDPNNDPLPPFPYDTSLDQIKTIEQFCTEKNVDYLELLENYEDVSAFLSSKGVDPGEFEDRVLVKLQDHRYELPPSVKHNIEKHINNFLKVEGKYDILNEEQVDLDYVNKLEKERDEAVWKTPQGEDMNIGARRKVFATIQKHLYDPDFHGIVTEDDIEGLKRILLDTESDLKPLFENSPFLRNFSKDLNLHYAMTSSNTPMKDPMPGVNSINEITAEFKKIVNKINQPPENPIETVEEFKKLEIDHIDYVRAMSSQNVYTIADYFSREEVRQYRHFLKEKFGYTGSLTPEVKAKMEEVDPEFAKEMEKKHEQDELERQKAIEWFNKHPNKTLLYGATASEIAQFAGLNEEQKDQLKEEIVKMRTPM